MIVAIVLSLLIGGGLVYLLTPKSPKFTAQEFSRLQYLRHHYDDVEKEMDKSMKESYTEGKSILKYNERTEYVYLKYKFENAQHLKH